MAKSPARNGGKRPAVTELPKITVHSDTRDILAHAIKERETDDYFIVDVDAHVMETAFWSELTDRIDNDVYRQMAKAFSDRGGSPPGLLNATPGMLYQDVFGRIPHQQRLAEAVPAGRTHAQVTLVQRAMDAMGIDYMVVFPTPMLVLGMHPQPEIEVALGNAFNRWLVEEILPQEPRIKAMLYLPFNHPEACIEVVERYGDTPGVIGFTVTSTRFRPVHHDSYMPLYAAIEATGKPFALPFRLPLGRPVDAAVQSLPVDARPVVRAFQPGASHQLAGQRAARAVPAAEGDLDRERARLGAVPHAAARFRIHDAVVRGAAAASGRRASTSARCIFTSQPLERSNMKLTEATFEAINADTQLLFASDWPHWDFDLPSSITTLPFLDAQAKRNILGLNAARLFNLEVPTQQARQEARRRPSACRFRHDGDALEVAGRAAAPGAPRAKPATPATTTVDAGVRVCRLGAGALARGDPDADPRSVAASGAGRGGDASMPPKRSGAAAPSSRFGDDAVTATETVVAVCAMIRAADLSPFDVAMWFNRLPG